MKRFVLLIALLLLISRVSFADQIIFVPLGSKGPQGPQGTPANFAVYDADNTLIGYTLLGDSSVLSSDELVNSKKYIVQLKPATFEEDKAYIGNFEFSLIDPYLYFLDPYSYRQYSDLIRPKLRV